MKTLLGSEKQIAWAEKIRKNIIDNINKHIDLFINGYENEFGEKYTEKANNDFEVLDKRKTVELQEIINTMETADRFIYIRDFTLLQMHKHLIGCIEKKIII